MLASSLRSIVVVECRDRDDPPSPGSTNAQASRAATQPTVLFNAALEGSAVALDWDVVGSRIVLAVAGAAGRGDRVSLVKTAPGGGEEKVMLPAGVAAKGISLACRPEEGSVWAAVACSDGALRLIDASKYPSKVTNVCRTHGSETMTVHISSDFQALASGSSGGHVVVQPFQKSAAPSNSVADEMEAAVTGVRFSPLRPNVLAACDEGGNIMVWDSDAMGVLCNFPRAHRGAGRCLSFSNHNQSLLISCGDDAKLIFLDVTSGKQIRQVAVESPLSSISYHRDGYRIAAGTRDGAVLIFDLRMLVKSTVVESPVHRLTAHQERGGGPLSAVAFAPLGYSPISTPNVVAGSFRSSRAEPVQTPGAAPAVDSDASLMASPIGSPTATSMQSMLHRLSGSASRTYPSPAGAEFTTPQRSISTTQSRRGSSAVAAAAAGDHVEGRTGVGAAAALEGVAGDAGLGGAVPASSSSAVATSSAAGGGQLSAPTSASQLRQLPQRGAGQAQIEAARYTPSGSPDQLPGDNAWLPSRSGDEAPEPMAGRRLNLDVAARGAHSSSGAVHGSDATTTEAPAPMERTSALVDAIRPLLAELRQELRNELRQEMSREVREAQSALLEQNFRLHAELRRDVEELRAEVQELRGELRVL
mmetsp:Transcript_85657/g.239316  ORF Transcript_85657/g.239316 Transcript_85657/m.239316 type:complete len:645 (-) Transcript_85657:174-2108(-)